MRCITACILTYVGFQACTPAQAAFHKSQQALSDGERLCVLQGVQLREIRVEYDLQTGDTLVEGRPISEVYPSGTPPYAATAEWFIRQDPLVFRTHRFTPYAPPRVIEPELLEAVGEFASVPLFAEAGAGEEAEILFVPVRPGCVFQQYVREAPY